MPTRVLVKQARNEFEAAPKSRKRSTAEKGRVIMIWFQCWTGQEDVDVFWL